MNIVISFNNKRGKIAFRLYPSLSSPTSKLAIISQKWQLDYFLDLSFETDIKKINKILEKICNSYFL